MNISIVLVKKPENHKEEVDPQNKSVRIDRTFYFNADNAESIGNESIGIIMIEIKQELLNILKMPYEK